MICEKCWDEAYVAALCNPIKSQTDYYREFIKERICTPKERAGPYWWDEDKQIDIRSSNA